MSHVKYFYVDPSGALHENPEILPLGALQEKHGDGLIFRFAIDIPAETFYIQDNSYKVGLGAGNEEHWHYANEALRYVSSKFKQKFMTRAYGDPPGTSIKRTLSFYRPAWQYLSEYMRDEINENPVDIAVCEFVPEEEGTPPVRLELPGLLCDGQIINAPSIAINRNLHKDAEIGSDSPDVDWALLNEVLGCFYLRHAARIFELTKGENEGKAFSNRIRKYKDDLGYDLMFAAVTGEDIKILKATDNELTEEQIRAGAGNPDHVVLFSYIPEQSRIVFHNYMPMEMAKHPMLATAMDEIKKVAAAGARKFPRDIIVSFDPAMCAPFVTRLSRFVVPWEMAQNRFGEHLSDISVIEVPFAVPEGAVVVRSSKEESESGKDFRIKHGLDVHYPFMMVDNRTHNLGAKYRFMLDSYQAYAQGAKTAGAKTLAEDVKASRMVKDPAENPRLAREMTFMLSVGMTRQDIIDFYCPRNKMACRAEYWKVLRATMFSLPQSGTKAQKTAAIGPTYDINSWWHRGLQEELNRAQHEEQRQMVEPFNLSKEKARGKQKEMSYEARLNDQRDKNLNYQKHTEQLLRESRI